jgi:hypothetical protein
METMKITKNETRTTWLCELGGCFYVRTLIDWNNEKPSTISWYPNEGYKEGKTYLTEEKLEELFQLQNVKLLSEKVKEKELLLLERTGHPMIFTLTGEQIQQWYDKKIVPEGFEEFGEFTSDWIDVDSGEYDSSKYSMTNYEICLYHTNGEDIWMGKGGYYNGDEHHFNNDIEFVWQE